MKRMILLLCFILLLTACTARPNSTAQTVSPTSVDAPTVTPLDPAAPTAEAPTFPVSGSDLPTAVPTDTAPPETASLTPDDTAAQPENEAQALLGVWRNEGQYTEGRDFVETLTMNADGSCTVHLDYQGASYQTLEGTWFVSDGTLVFRLDDPSGPVERVFLYTLRGDTLILDSGEKIVGYDRVS